MTADLALLSTMSPDWAKRLGPGNASEWLAAPPLPSGAAVPPFMLRIRSDEGALVVSERTIGDRLPARCPELHVNRNSTFCIARRGFAARSRTDAAAFWQTLGEYLVNQTYAERRGRWPAGRWLSHGSEAADAQLVAETEARAAGVAEDYALWLESGEGWLADFFPNERSGRPLGCVDAEGQAITLRSCVHRGAVGRLLDAEARRRAAEREFFDYLRQCGDRCCGRVAGCPLAGIANGGVGA